MLIPFLLTRTVMQLALIANKRQEMAASGQFLFCTNASQNFTSEESPHLLSFGGLDLAEVTDKDKGNVFQYFSDLKHKRRVMCTCRLEMFTIELDTRPPIIGH